MRWGALSQLRPGSRVLSLALAMLAMTLVFYGGASFLSATAAWADGGCYDEFNCESLAHDYNLGQPFTQSSWSQQVPAGNLSNFTLQSGERVSCGLSNGQVLWGQDSAWFRFDAGVTGTLSVTADSTAGGASGFNLFMISYESTKETGIDYTSNADLQSEDCTAVGHTESYDLNVHTTGPTFVQVLASCGDAANGAATPCPHPIAAGPVTMSFKFTCTDTDGDGVCDSVDQCPTVAAHTANGCPAAVAAPSVTSAPTISGTTVVGHPLSATTGVWSGSPIAYGYQWQRCSATGTNCTAIAGATTPTYTPTAADAGHEISVQVTATNSGGSGVSSSLVTAPVGTPQAPALQGRPHVSGVAAEGHILTASVGSWSYDAADPISYSYRWQRCSRAASHCATIKGAGQRTYKVTSADAGHRLRLGVAARNVGGGSAVAYSAATPLVVNPRLDSDHDGVPNRRDKCPFVFALTRYVQTKGGRRGCPAPLAVEFSDNYVGTASLVVETDIQLSNVAPGSRVSVACEGGGCPAGAIVSFKPSGHGVVLNGELERTPLWHSAAGGLPAGGYVRVGQKLIIAVTHRGALPWYREVVPQAGRPPVDLCAAGISDFKPCSAT